MKKTLPCPALVCPPLSLRSLVKGFALLALLFGLAPAVLLAHPDKVEKQVLTHFATGLHKPENGEWEDITHSAAATIHGAPVYTNIGPAQALVLNGVEDYLVIASSPKDAAKWLPAKEFSAAAWVLLKETTQEGGITGLVQDNGEYEKGWCLGYNEQVFTFTLATKGKDDGNGKLTRLAGKTPITPGQWHHVAAVYDGAAMRLYVNGKLDGESREQSGDILYPERGQYVLGAYRDDNEFYSMNGAIYEVKTYGRVLAQAELEETVARNQILVDYRAPVSPLKFVVKPYLQFGTTNSIKILCETTEPSTMTVEFAERQPLTNSVQSVEAKSINEVALTDLKPFTIYFYRVVCANANGDIATSEIYTFQTMPGEDMPWAFGILGDTQRNPEVTRRCAEGIFALRPNFMLHCGDVVDDGFAKHQWVNDLFEPASRLFAHVPAFPVIGNHEKNSHWYYDYFSLPDPEYFYTFKVGNAEFFMVDSNKDTRPGSEQYQRLEAALAKSKSTWKFAAHHHPCFSSDENDYGDKWLGKSRGEFLHGDLEARPLIQLYEKYGVDIVFAGHIHSYERTWPILNMTINQKKGVRYIVSGGGGGGLEQAGPQRSWFSVHVARGHHYCFAAVHDRTIEFKAYDLEGRMFDTFAFTKDEDR